MIIQEIQISYLPSFPVKRNTITNRHDAVKVFRKAFKKETIKHREFAYLMTLDAAHQITSLTKVADGGINTCLIDPKLVFQIALKSNASYFLLAHNHPSGNVKPSNADKAMAQRINSAAEFLDLPCLDNLIITGHSSKSIL